MSLSNHPTVHSFWQVNRFHRFEVYPGRAASFSVYIYVSHLIQHQLSKDHDQLRHCCSHTAQIYFASDKALVPREELASLGNRKSPSTSIYVWILGIYKILDIMLFLWSVFLLQTYQHLQPKSAPIHLLNRLLLRMHGKVGHHTGQPRGASY